MQCRDQWPERWVAAWRTMTPPHTDPEGVPAECHRPVIDTTVDAHARATRAALLGTSAHSARGDPAPGPFRRDRWVAAGRRVADLATDPDRNRPRRPRQQDALRPDRDGRRGS